ncbi:MAG TPA: SulP family inorganic anion transporter [Bacteroidales bacterium]|jgi:sulfate permease, SulP family|nr:SulP family inorganic anion transporter [Bacteroidales bacterium]HNW67540.1 SulP family inorganic anion transporter [Bacteroidales bacterium]HPT51822.1 SulP family inorganic anion transporter [Bacteroidales bacterium]
MKIFDKNNLKGDIFGGITAGIVALPLALAFGIQAFGVINVEDVGNIGAIGALAGLTGAMLLGFFASMFGGTPSQISGPTGPMTVISATLISTVWATSQPNSIETVIISMSLAAILCGVFQILFGIIKIGKYIRYIPYPVLSGFMSGIGIIIIVQQIYPLLGMKSPVLIVDMITQLPGKIGGFDVIALLLGLGTVAIIYLFPLLTKKIPSTLVALIVMTIVSVLIKFNTQLTIGEIPSGLPMPFFVSHEVGGIDWWAVIKISVIPGLTLAGLGSIDTLLTSVVADNTTKTKHNSNQELIGQGIGNTVVGIFAGLPGAGATMRTIVNINSGGRTRLSGMIHGIFLLAVFLGLGKLVQFVPLSVLAGILITVGIGIIDFKGLKDFFKIPRADAVVLITVLVLTVFVDLLIAVGIGMIIACVLFMKRAGDLVESGYHSDQISKFDKELAWDDEKDMPKEIQRKIYIQRLNGPIFFGSITRFQEIMNEIPDDAKIVIIRMKLVSFMDQSGLYAMETAIKDLQDRGVTVLMTIIQPQPMYMLKRMNVIPNIVPEENTFKTFEECNRFLSAAIFQD